MPTGECGGASSAAVFRGAPGDSEIEFPGQVTAAELASGRVRMPSHVAEVHAGTLTIAWYVRAGENEDGVPVFVHRVDVLDGDGSNRTPKG
jgi:hypothetical protein